MPDIRSTNAPGNVTNDLKVRPAFDIEGGDNGQFLDAMIANLTANSADDAAQPKAAKISAADQSRDNAYLDRLKALRNADKADEAPAAVKVDAKADVKEKIKAKIAELAQRDETPVKDDRPLKALKKVAEFLLKAEEQGKIELPPELSQKLEEFMAKGDDLKATDVALFMHEFVQMFKALNVVLPAPVLKSAAAAIKDANAAVDGAAAIDAAAVPADGVVAADAEPDDVLVWPKEIADAFKELKLGGLALENQPVKPLELLKAVKALVNNSEKAALATLADKAQAALMVQSTAEILVPKASVDKLAALLNDVLKPAEQNAAAPAAQVIKASDAQNLVVQAVVAAAPLQINAAKTELSADAKLAAAADGDLPDLLGLKPDTLDAPLLPQQANAKDANKADAMLRDNAPQQNAAPAQQQNTPAATAAAVIAAVARAEAAASSSDKNAAEPVAAASADMAAQNIDSDAGPLTAAHNAGRFAKALNAAAGAQSAQPSSATQQVLVQIQNRANKSSQINLQLSPAELGRVDIRLNVGRDGQAYAVVMADKPETLSLLQKDASHLEKALQQAGLNASQENMSFNLREQRQQSGGFAGRKRLQRDPVVEGAAADLALNVHSDGQIISDTRVNYHA